MLCEPPGEHLVDLSDDPVYPGFVILGPIRGVEGRTSLKDYPSVAVQVGDGLAWRDRGMALGEDSQFMALA